MTQVEISHDDFFFLQDVCQPDTSSSYSRRSVKNEWNGGTPGVLVRWRVVFHRGTDAARAHEEMPSRWRSGLPRLQAVLAAWVTDVAAAGSWKEARSRWPAGAVDCSSVPYQRLLDSIRCATG